MIKKLMTARRFIAAGMLTAFMFVGIASVNAQLSDGLIGYWPLDEGDGTTAANSAGGEDAELYNGVEWVDDPDRGVVLSFDGVDAYADAGAETIPQMTQDNDFTWSVWINQAGGNGPNDVVLGNRYGPEGTDFAPREFIKFTPTKFEFHLDGGGQNCEFDDLANSEGEWIHHVVVKTGDTFTHYTNGIEDESSTFTSELQNPQPFYFGGDQANENWNGMLDDIAIWDRALSADEVSSLNSGGIPAQNAPLASFLIDFGGAAANSAGASPDPWITFDNLVMDETVDLGGGATLTALDDGFNPNNPAQPGEGAEYDGVVVPQEARNDYFFKIADTAGTTARMRFDGLPAGSYKVTVFEGRTTDDNQVAKIWTGEEPEEENTGNFAQGSATVEVNVGAGEPLWYMHLEDNTGGVSGLIIRQTSSGTPERSVTWDFNGGLPDGSEVAGSAEHSEDEGVDDSGALVITRAENESIRWMAE